MGQFDAYCVHCGGRGWVHCSRCGGAGFRGLGLCYCGDGRQRCNRCKGKGAIYSKKAEQAYHQAKKEARRKAEDDARSLKKQAKKSSGRARSGQSTGNATPSAGGSDNGFHELTGLLFMIAVIAPVFWISMTYGWFAQNTLVWMGVYVASAIIGRVIYDRVEIVRRIAKIAVALTIIGGIIWCVLWMRAQ